MVSGFGAPVARLEPAIEGVKTLKRAERRTICARHLIRGFGGQGLATPPYDLQGPFHSEFKSATDTFS
ncbi:hypothetical protein PoB_000141800 [Plakobranchus ocellatus]|uniref:Uncharacterized protein n=1 Tax=Plakobranchus ocellatus TaxID=259542 RepID=A0AAV3XX13_9GAST|nr:hypothetical protein PoB_000141800 [Plakobranchus ocellatus]